MSKKVSQQQQPLAQKQVRQQSNGRIAGTQKNFTVEMKELLADVQAATTFSPQQISINPGLPSTFAWLSQIAGAYEKYKLKKMSFEIMPQCPATTVGGSGMYIDYDANDGTVTTKSDFFAMSGAQVQQIWQAVHLNVAVSNKEYFVRNGPVSDSKLLYDHMSFNYFVESDTTAPNVLIFVKYEFEFLKPQVNMNAQSPTPGVLIAQWTDVLVSTDTNIPEYNSGMIEGTSGKMQVPVDGDYLITAYITSEASTNPSITVFGVSLGVFDSSGAETGATRGKVAPLTALTDYTALSSSPQLNGDVVVTLTKL